MGPSALDAGVGPPTRVQDVVAVSGGAGTEPFVAKYSTLPPKAELTVFIKLLRVFTRVVPVVRSCRRVDQAQRLFHFPCDTDVVR